MEASQFWLLLLIGVAIGLLLSIALKWIGKKLLRRNQQEEGGGANGEKEIGPKIHLH